MTRKERRILAAVTFVFIIVVAVYWFLNQAGSISSDIDAYCVNDAGTVCVSVKKQLWILEKEGVVRTIGNPIKEPLYMDADDDSLTVYSAVRSVRLDMAGNVLSETKLSKRAISQILGEDVCSAEGTRYSYTKAFFRYAILETDQDGTETVRYRMPTFDYLVLLIFAGAMVLCVSFIPLYVLHFALQRRFSANGSIRPPKSATAK